MTTKDDKKEALRFFEGELNRFHELRVYFHQRGDKSTPNLDKKIRMFHAAIMALTEPSERRQ